MKVAVLAVSLLLVAGVARADRPGAQAGARAHFLAGLDLYGQGKYAAALVEYQEAWVTWQDPELLLDMAECNRHLGNRDLAREQYRGFLARAPQSSLRGSVERRLARLDHADADAPPPAALVVPPAPQPLDARAEPAGHPDHAGRAAKAIGIAGWAASVVAIGVGIYTWHALGSVEQTGHQELVQLRPMPLTSPEQTAFFQNPTCSPPPSLMGTDGYRRDCKRGEQLSAATTAMFVGSAAFAAAGTVAYLIGTRQSSRARERALSVTPIVGWSTAGLQLRYSF